MAGAYGFSDADFNITVAPTSYQGAACSFPLSLARAVRATFEIINRQAFRDLVPPGTIGAYRIRVDFSSFNPDMRFEPRFFGGAAVAHAEISLRVSVTDPDGVEIARQVIRGLGMRQNDAMSCDEGSAALSGAVQQALREVGEEYADRIVNALRIK
jgi:hypothetical protein